MPVHLDQPRGLPPGRETQSPSGMAEWLCLVATPTFAAMALLTATTGADMICTAVPGVFPVGGMAPMYALMSVFHLAPWLKLFGRR